MWLQQNKTNTGHSILAHGHENRHGPRGTEWSRHVGKETASPGCLEGQGDCFWPWLLGSAAGTGEAVMGGLGRGPRPTLEVQVIGWMCFSVGKMPQTPPSLPEGGGCGGRGELIAPTAHGQEAS